MVDKSFFLALSSPGLGMDVLFIWFYGLGVGLPVDSDV